MGKTMLTGEQVRAGRAILRMDQMTLAREAGISVETVKRLEKLDGPIDAKAETLEAIEDVFVSAGLILEADGSVRRGADRNALLVSSLAAQMVGLAAATLEKWVKDDPSFFARGPQYVAKRICALLNQQRLEQMVELAEKLISGPTPKHSSESDDQAC
jgi:transcriptional regulator with XRE-family HTH domain